MRTYDSLKGYIAALPGVPADVTFHAGPDLPDVPGRFVALTRYGGTGEELDGAMDGVSWQVRVAGLQGDYTDAETLADAIDVGLLSVGTRDVGGVHVAGCQRVGGAPNPDTVDDSDRYQFVCSYIISTSLTLTH